MALDARDRLQSTKAGVRDTELKELAVNPTSRPSAVRAVTMVTPVANIASEARNSVGENRGMLALALGSVINISPLFSPMRPGDTAVRACPAGATASPDTVWRSARIKLMRMHACRPIRLIPLLFAMVTGAATVGALAAPPSRGTAVTSSAPRAAPAPVASPCEEFSTKLPNVRRELCDSSELRPTAVRSVQGQTLWVRDIEPEHANTRVLVVGAIHGDESSSASVALHWLRLAQQSPADSPQLVHWRFVPVLNPDGLFSKPPRRMNANGVDLNRNFPTPNWERDAKIYWEKRTNKDPRRYPGTKPLSEPESKFLHDQMQSFKPDLIVSIHAPYGVLDFDGPSVPPSRLGRLYLDQVGIFPGSLGNYGGVHKGVPVVTIELPNSTRTPLDSEMRQMWLDLQRWMSERLDNGAGGDGGRSAGRGPSRPKP